MLAKEIFEMDLVNKIWVFEVVWLINFEFFFIFFYVAQKLSNFFSTESYYRYTCWGQFLSRI